MLSTVWRSRSLAPIRTVATRLKPGASPRGFSEQPSTDEKCSARSEKLGQDKRWNIERTNPGKGVGERTRDCHRWIGKRGRRGEPIGCRYVQADRRCHGRTVGLQRQ